MLSVKTVHSYTATSPEETETLGEKLGALLQSGDIIGLTGILGAGKTCFVRGLSRGWGAVEKVTSPTFALMNIYHHSERSEVLYHLDCYRLESAAESWTLGIDDILDGDNVVVIEWSERIASVLPREMLRVTISIKDVSSRTLNFEATGPRARFLLDSLPR
jgi:tRNA threonylcarbamoyladenosine biosynthesis protein TsaE